MFPRTTSCVTAPTCRGKLRERSTPFSHRAAARAMGRVGSQRVGREGFHAAAMKGLGYSTDDSRMLVEERRRFHESADNP